MDRGLLKQHAKQAVRRTIGEPYVGKRLKLRRVAPAMRALDLHPTSILDAGAEDATFVYWLADRYPTADVTAVDIDDDAMRNCIAARPAKYANRVHFRTMSFDQLDPESFDLITAFDVFEHIKDDHGAAVALFRALRPGGHLLVHVPRDQWTTRDGTIHRFSDEDAWQINAGHVRMGYSPESLRALVEQAGFTVDEEATWLRRHAVLAHEVYTRLEHPAPLRLLTIPVTDTLALLDRRRPADEGNSVWIAARKLA